MQVASRGARLGRRYPILAQVPEDKRPEIVRAALRRPLLLLPVLLAALLLLPLYFDFAFARLGIGGAPQSIFDLGKIGCAMLLPVVIAVPLLSRFALPHFIAGEMKKRGYKLEQ